jgi:hypothetical protein
MDSQRLINLRLRKWIFDICNFVAPVVAKTGLGRLRLNDRPLGRMIYTFFFKVLHFKLPDRIETKGLIVYHRSAERKNWLGWLYGFDYEPQTYRVFTDILKPEMTIVDAGAHIGYYSLLAGKLVGEKGNVYAFEPDPSYYSLLKKNIKKISRLTN